jgi:catechol 2,3-dioxygenase-like lactoylglutathione lyase family enzyme
MITATMVVPTVPVTDLERAKKFYGDTVGLTFLWETPVAVRFRQRDFRLQAPAHSDRAHACSL